MNDFEEFLRYIEAEKGLTPAELEQVTEAAGWCDVCKGWEE